MCSSISVASLIDVSVGGRSWAHGGARVAPMEMRRVCPNALRYRTFGSSSWLGYPNDRSAFGAWMSEGKGLVGTTIAGKYRIRRLIGVGGMGSVYEGQHVDLAKK